MSTKRKITITIVAVLVIGAILRIAVPDIFAVGKPLVSVKAEEVFHIGSFIVTNSLIVTVLVSLLLIILSAIATSKLRAGDEQALREPRGLQNFMEMSVEGIYNLMAGVSPKYVGRFFVIVATIFLLLLPANWFGILPGVGSVGLCFEYHGLEHAEDDHVELATEEGVEPITDAPEGTDPQEATSTYTNSCEGREDGHTVFHPFLRAGSADLNMALALALISFFVTEYWGFRTQGIGYLGKFFNFRGGVIGFFVGIVELISEFARIISFTFRLFGNIFAGEVVLFVMAFLFPYVLGLPFYGLEVFVGFIQAFVFAMLTMAFIDLAAESHHGDEHGEHEHAH